jgi:hypothetical protein
VAADGTEIVCDLPGDFHRRNVSSRGEGCCVFRSLHHAAVWQDLPELTDFPEWLQAKGLPGGGHPANVRERIEAICRERGRPTPDYLQVEGNDLEVLKLACRTGRMPGVTYYYSPTGRYPGRINHMVSLVHADDRHFVVLDSNYPGPDKYEWMTPEQFLHSYTGGGRGGWAVVLLRPGPPPPPRNPR